jgi:hypothetical protein
MSKGENMNVIDGIKAKSLSRKKEKGVTDRQIEKSWLRCSNKILSGQSSQMNICHLRIVRKLVLTQTSLSELTERQKKFSGFPGETSDKIVGLTGRCGFVLRNGKSGM